MWIKVVAYTPVGEGSHEPGELMDLRESTALLWINNGWAIARPDLEEKKEPEPEPEPEPVKEPEVETAALAGAPETTEGPGNRRKR